MDGLTHLEVKVDTTYKGLGIVMEFILGKAIVKMQFQNMVKSLRMLKAICENQHANITISLKNIGFFRHYLVKYKKEMFAIPSKFLHKTIPYLITY